MIAICIGDVTGIGPEVALKAVAAELGRDGARYLLIGDMEILRALNRRLGLRLPLNPHTADNASERLRVFSPVDLPNLAGPLSPGAAAASKAAVACLRAGAQFCLSGTAEALVTAPVSKEAIIRSGQPFVGQTEFLSQLAGTERTVMMLLGPDDRERWLRVALATTHLPIREVADRVTREKVELAIQLAAQACRDLGLARARVGVCGLNPHAGEGGKMGTEDQAVIAPAVESARQAGIEAVGPVPADTLFYHALRGDYDAVVAMYHDQGLGPLKMIAFESGVNWTLGLPFIRTSPDHGTAYDIAGQGSASPSSMIAAVRLAKQLTEKREKLQ